MKEAFLRKKNIVNFSISGALLITFCAITYYNFKKNSEAEIQIESIKQETDQLKSQASELLSKTIEIKKYKEMWTTLPDSRKSTAGIKVDDVNARLTFLAEKYSIINPIIKITLPEPLNEGIFKRITINVLLTKININFEAIDDSRALMFISDFSSSLPGYLLLDNFEMKKNKKYSKEELVAISLGKGVGAIKGSVEFLWYSYKNKDGDKKPEEITIKQNNN